MARTPEQVREDEAVQKVARCFEEAERFHRNHRSKWERWYRAYEGVLKTGSESRDWRSQVHPPYVNDAIESAVANLVEHNLRFRVEPRPLEASPQEIERARRGAEAHQRLLGYQLDIDRFGSKQREFILQDLICGLTVGKTFWLERTRDTPGREMVQEPIRDDLTGEVLDVRTRYQDITRRRTLRDDPTFETVDVRDWFWPESATSLDKAPWVIHRVWMSMDELRSMQERGVYRNVDDVPDSGSSQTDDFAERESGLWNVDRTKGLISVLEWWSDERVVTVANCKVLLADRPNPFWHGRKPFVVATGTGRLFQVPGMSEVYKLAEIQEMIWALMNQRLDNLKFVNNAIALIRSDVMDPDEFEWFPGARWMVDDTSQVEMWTPDTRVAEVSLNSESLLKGDLANVSGGLPALSGANMDTIDQNTATGMSIVTSLAQKRIMARRAAYWESFDRVCDQWTWLNRQFVTQPKLVSVLGTDGARAWEYIDPRDLEPDVLVSSEPMTESLMRQERRAEAQALLQTAAQAAAAFAATGQPLNLKAFMDEYLMAFGHDDTSRFYASQPPQMQPGSPQGPVPGTPGFASPDQGPGGVTAPQSIDPATSPSNQVSMSPEVFLQRALAGAGPQQ